MITGFDSKTRKNDAMLLAKIVLSFVIVGWLFSPPGNKFLQMTFWANKTKFFVMKIFNPDKANEYKYYRNNAIYLAKMYPDKYDAIREMDKAINSLPSIAPEKVLKSLYRDRAEIKLFLGDRDGALNDYVNSGEASYVDCIKISFLLQEKGNYAQALSYCNRIINDDIKAYAGYACLSSIYEGVNRSDYALKVLDLAIERNSSRARAYLDRARLKKMQGDISGYQNDIAKAKDYNPYLREDVTYKDEVLNPRILSLSIQS